MNKKLETATLAGGCFWCTEAIFKRLKGIVLATPGYSGGTIKNPTYEEISSGRTGHAESIQIKFDPKQISFEKILDVFWHTHNPTTLNQQGSDFGTQYRSAIFYHNEKQRKTAERSKMELEKSGMYPEKVVTEITPFISFYEAENYHKDYFEHHKEAPYCTLVIDPKIRKLMETYTKNIKEEYKR